MFKEKQEGQSADVKSPFAEPVQRTNGVPAVDPSATQAILETKMNESDDDDQQIDLEKEEMEDKDSENDPSSNSW